MTADKGWRRVSALSAPLREAAAGVALIGAGLQRCGSALQQTAELVELVTSGEGGGWMELRPLVGAWRRLTEAEEAGQ